MDNNNITPANLKLGDRVSFNKTFTSPIGASFRAGHVFTVDLVGPVSIRLKADLCGSGVWVTDGYLLVADAESRSWEVSS